ncbi:hypothetical protein D3C72_1840520 [compost metagenome]
MYCTNFSARSCLVESFITPIDCAQRTAPCSGIVQSRSGLSAESTAVIHSPPPTRISTSPVASAVWEETTSLTCFDIARIAASFSLIAGMSASVRSAVFLPSPRPTRPIIGR